jgi:hypothetical protein
MCAEPAKDSIGDSLGDRIAAALGAKVNPQCFQTWFAPIGFSDCDGELCSLTVPTEVFRQALLDNYADILQEALAEAAGKQLRLNLAVRDQNAQPDPASLLPVFRASELQAAQEQKPWLIERLWSAGAVGIVSGPPKALKTWMALEMALSVAAGVPCLETFPVHCSGTVLLYAAEEPRPALHSRLQVLAQNHGLKLDQVDIRVIAADSLRLDRQQDRELLAATVAFHRPVLLILDPLIRLHGLDENQSGPMAELLGYFRTLQRSTGTAIIIVHHSTKHRTSSSAPGQRLRGSSDLYAFVDSLVFLDRRRNQVTLSAEHRSAPGLAPMSLELTPPIEPDQCLSLRLHSLIEHDLPQSPGLSDRILQHLASAANPVTTDALRSSLRVRKQRVIEALHKLQARGLIGRTENGYALSSTTGGE